MSQSQWNAYSNAAFGNGRFGTVQMMIGGNLEIAAKDTIEVNENGLLMHHNDDYETLTLVPWANIAYIRTRARVNRDVNKVVELPPSDGWSQEIGDGGDNAPRKLPQ